MRAFSRYLRGSAAVTPWLALLVLACGPSAPRPVTTRLVELFPLAELARETAELDFGSQSSRTHLLEGWSTPQTTEQGLSYTWVMARSSGILLHFFDLRPRQLVLTGWPYRFPGAPDQVVTVELNGSEIATLPMTDPRIRDYTVSLPVPSQRLGVNELRLRFAYVQRPIDVHPASRDVRSLAAAWTRARIVDTEGHGSPRVEEPEQLVLPLASSVTYYLDLPDPARLTLDGLAPWGGARIYSRPDLERALTLELQLAGEPEARALTLSADGDAYAVELPGSPHGPARLTLTAAPATREVRSPAGLQLDNPVVLSTVPPLTDLALGLADRPARTPLPDRHDRPNILIYLVDTLRADHLGCYGYPLPTSPRIDDFARDATLFERPYAQASWTRAAIASLFTGLYTPSHGTVRRLDALSDSARLLPGTLSDLGYRTGAVVTNGNVSSQFGFSRGFETYHQLPEQPDHREIHQLSDRVNEAAFKWLEEPAAEPFFLYLHTTDPHGPYAPRSPYRERLAAHVDDPELGSMATLNALTTGELRASPELLSDLVALYDAEIAFNDAQLGRLIDKLRDLDLYDSTLIVFLSDHGEEFLDHGFWEHGSSLFNELIHVPLIVKFPDGLGKGVSVSRPVRQIDVFPTLLDYLGQPIPPELEGSSLLPHVVGSADHRTGGEVPATLSHLGINRIEMTSLIWHGKKLILTEQDLSAARRRWPNVELFDLGSDFGERDDVAARHPVWAGYLATLLRHHQLFGDAASPGTEVEIDEDLRQRLQALGYLD